jgi:hypothetical protein
MVVMLLPTMPELFMLLLLDPATSWLELPAMWLPEGAELVALAA